MSTNNEVTFFARWDPRGLAVLALFTIPFNVLGFGPEFHYRVLGNTDAIATVPGGGRLFIAAIACALDLLCFAIIVLMVRDVRRLRRGEPLAPPGMVAVSPVARTDPKARTAEPPETGASPPEFVDENAGEVAANLAEVLAPDGQDPATPASERRPSAGYHHWLVRLGLVGGALAVGTVVSVNHAPHSGWAVMGVFGAIAFFVGLFGVSLLQLIRVTVFVLALLGVVGTYAATIIHDDAARGAAQPDVGPRTIHWSPWLSTALRDSSRSLTVAVRAILVGCVVAFGIGIVLMGLSLAGIWL